MHDLALKQSFFITFVLFMIISLSWHVGIVTTVQGESPSFVRQEIVDSSGDWIFWKGSSSSSQSNKTQLNTHGGNIVEVEKADNPSECEIGKGSNYIPPPDIQSVSYISDGKKLNATVWLTSPFEEPPLNDTIDIFQEEIKIIISP